MPVITKVFGPIRTEIMQTRIRWVFHGYKDSGEFCRWALSFYFDSRKFRTKRIKRQRGDERFEGADLFPAYKTTGTPMKGTVTAILRKHLSDEHVAEATRHALRRSP